MSGEPNCDDTESEEYAVCEGKDPPRPGEPRNARRRRIRKREKERAMAASSSAGSAAVEKDENLDFVLKTWMTKGDSDSTSDSDAAAGEAYRVQAVDKEGKIMTVECFEGLTLEQQNIAEHEMYGPDFAPDSEDVHAGHIEIYGWVEDWMQMGRQCICRDEALRLVQSIRRALSSNSWCPVMSKTWIDWDATEATLNQLAMTSRVCIKVRPRLNLKKKKMLLESVLNVDLHVYTKEGKRVVPKVQWESSSPVRKLMSDRIYDCRAVASRATTEAELRQTFSEVFQTGIAACQVNWDRWNKGGGKERPRQKMRSLDVLEAEFKKKRHADIV